VTLITLADLGCAGITDIGVFTYLAITISTGVALIRIDHSNVGSDSQDLGQLDTETDGTRKFLEDVVTQEGLAEIYFVQHMTTKLVFFCVVSDIEVAVFHVFHVDFKLSLADRGGIARCMGVVPGADVLRNIDATEVGVREARRKVFEVVGVIGHVRIVVVHGIHQNHEGQLRLTTGGQVKTGLLDNEFGFPGLGGPFGCGGAFGILGPRSGIGHDISTDD
jgi:hypothetical protein